LDCIRTSGDTTKGTGIYLREPDGIDELMLALDQSVAATLDGKTLQTLIIVKNRSRAPGDLPISVRY
ncbi:MAG TPA: hypothetical protein VMR88_08010, partial [Candidatus Polarisedimenticolaceae bacterium]|nr:hypothetical protein [Candidatus Polarisedimenticolaceae bacterium]